VGLFVQILAYVLLIAMFIRIIFSWTGFDASSPIFAVVHEITEPILAPIRAIMPRIGMFDFSPMIAMFILFALARLGAELAAG
jgi:YggT family protein